MSLLVPEKCFYFSKVAGIGLIFALWVGSGEMAGFFLFLLLLLMTVIRWRFPYLGATVIIDGVVCIAVIGLWEYAYLALIFTLFEGVYRRFYPIIIFGLAPAFFISFHYPHIHYILLSTLGVLCGFFLERWLQEKEEKIAIRDDVAGKYYDVESIKEELPDMLTRLERMTALSERNRIAREIHDNAGHEIVAANISLQVARGMLNSGSTSLEKHQEALELYDAALERLDVGVNKIREAVHNLQSTTSIGVESLLEICRDFPPCPVDFKMYGDSSKIPVYIWNILESCLNECLTNVMRHAKASHVFVTLDVTEYMVRLCIENDGVDKTISNDRRGLGSGLKNLQHRAVTVGGSLSVDAGELFRVICVMPLEDDEEKGTDK